MLLIHYASHLIFHEEIPYTRRFAENLLKRRGELLEDLQ